MSTTSTATLTPAPDLATFALAAGFHSAATACGLKPSGNLDLGMVWSDGPCAAAGVFTTNRVQAAPVHVCIDTLANAAGHVRGVLYNSGCANAVTGERGVADARRMRELGAEAIGAEPVELLVLSTGVIGKFLDMEKLARGVTTLRSHAALRSAGDAARAIMTTDTRAKLAFAPLVLPGGRATIAGFAKGAGMIHPNMATMLGVVTTDARLDSTRLDRSLRAAVERSFNRISVDGDMSTNDTVLLLASGASGAAVDEAGEPAFTAALTDVCSSLARQIARDGEGATRLVELRVTGGATERQAHRVGDAIAFLDPIFSSGVYLATQSAELSSVEILKAFRENRFEARRFRGYQKAIRRGMQPFQRFIRNFYDPSFTEMFLKPREYAGMVDGVTGVLAGGAFLRMSLRMRLSLEVFFTIVRINRWVRRRRGLTTESRYKW